MFDRLGGHTATNIINSTAIPVNKVEWSPEKHKVWRWRGDSRIDAESYCALRKEHEMVSESIVAMMVEYRKKQGWSQFAFGQKLHVSERTIRRNESGEVTPTLEVVESFARLIGKTMAELMAELGEESETDRRERRFLDDVWDAHLAWFSSAGQTDEKR